MQASERIAGGSGTRTASAFLYLHAHVHPAFTEVSNTRGCRSLGHAPAPALSPAGLHSQEGGEAEGRRNRVGSGWLPQQDPDAEATHALKKYYDVAPQTRAFG